MSQRWKLGRIRTAGMLLGITLLFSGCAASQVGGPDESTSDFTLPNGTVLEATAASERNSVEETDSLEGSASSEGTDISGEVSSPYAVDPSTETSREENPNRVVVLDPGHGGAYTGANYQGFMEKDLALKVSQYIKEYLEANYKGVTVYLTRNEDMGFSNDQKADLQRRVEIARDLGAEILVSIHFNSDGSTHASTGALVCVSKQVWVKDESLALAGSILGQLERLGINNKGPLLRDSDEYFDEYGNSMDYYAICRHSASAGFPGIIVEHCFMDNPAELPFFGSEEALQRLAMADAVGIAEFMGLEAK